jgi:MFS family permease
VGFALIAFRFQRDHIVGVAAISIWFAVAMAVAAIAPPILGRLFDRIGNRWSQLPWFLPLPRLRWPFSVAER